MKDKLKESNQWKVPLGFEGRCGENGKDIEGIICPLCPLPNLLWDSPLPFHNSLPIKPPTSLLFYAHSKFQLPH
ncbi:unnamed protein product [Citrullus colocynthis]|uniref:Uncharacterized protein n=1 Tax=Citrullus colocynthis TaxID=252529 RepID=A0ABP0ZA08_9ROSI